MNTTSTCNVIVSENTGKICNSEFSGKLQQIWKWICIVVHKQIYNEICKQEKEKRNLKRKFDGKRVMSACYPQHHHLQIAYLHLCQMFRRGKWYWSKDSLEFWNRKNSVVTLLWMTAAPVTLVDNYWFQAMWTTHGARSANHQHWQKL